VPNLRDFERRLGGLVEGLFSKTFRSGLQPVELAKRIVREMDDGKQVGINETWAPNRFEVFLSGEDAGRFEQAETVLIAELKKLIRETAAERGWGLVGPPEVQLFMDDQLRKGDLVVESSLVQGEDEEPAVPAVSESRALLIVQEDGASKSVPLAGDVLTIGRLPDCDVVITDKGASRRHAQLRNEAGAWTITDLGSTNGTRLNGQTVQSRELADGDRITIGTTVLEFRQG
jgi:hypothetical protein